MARLLVVDDDPDARRLSGLVLRRAGHEVRYAEDGFQALEAMARERPDLVIPDLMLPGMDGLEVLEAMGRREDLAAIPVIVLTARTQIPPAAGPRGTVHAYLTKPISAEGLVRSVQEALEATRPSPASEARAVEIACLETWPGGGVDLLAPALAAALAAHAPTLLIDVEGLGRGALAFDGEPQRLAAEPESPSGGIPEPIPVGEGLSVWSIWGSLPAALLERMAGSLTARARWAVWMVGDPMGPLAAAVLPRCQRIFVTFESHTPGMRRARFVLRVLEERGLRPPAVQPVWVRRWAVPEPWTEEEIRYRLGGMPILVWPVDPVTAHRALQEGRPIQDVEPESPTARRVREWAAQILRLTPPGG